MVKQFVCERCGEVYTRMLIDWPQFCSMECVGDTEPCDLNAGPGSRQTGASTKANGRAEKNFAPSRSFYLPGNPTRIH